MNKQAPPVGQQDEKCCIKDCVRTGIPSEGYDFYICEECCELLDKMIQDGYRKRFQKHEVN